MSCYLPCIEDKTSPSSNLFPENSSSGSPVMSGSQRDQDHAPEGSPVPIRRKKDDDSMEFYAPSTAHESGYESDYECDGPHPIDSSKSETSSAVSQYLGTLEMLKRPHTDWELAGEAKRIYAQVALVEKTCQKFHEQYTCKAQLSDTQWREMISWHQILLQKHQEFFLASQHPSASSELRLSAKEYAMPARMWEFGIHKFLNLLKENLPTTLHYIRSFINFANSIITPLRKSAPEFDGNWTGCLADLARYRMAVEPNTKDREVWAGASRYWYNRNADISPTIGRIQHHLGVLAHADPLQQLFHYTKALVSVSPFLEAREVTEILFSPYRGQNMALSQHTMTTAFLATHCSLYHGRQADEFMTLANHFLLLLREEAVQDQTGVYIMSCNFTSILQYGDPEAIVALEFAQKDSESASEPSQVESLSTSVLDLETHVKDARGPTASSVDLPPMALQGTVLSFQTLSILLDSVNGSSVCPIAHISLSFIWGLAMRPNAMQQLEKFIPWNSISRFLNALIGPDIIFDKIEDKAFPLYPGVARCLPEDFLIRGLIWSQLYFPRDFFQDTPSTEERPVLEDPSIGISRKHRCLWLGVRIATATLGRWIMYNYNHRKFDVTQVCD